MDKVCTFSENVDRLQLNHTDSAFLKDLSYVAHHACQLVSSEYMMQKPRSERLALAVKIYRVLTDDSSADLEALVLLLKSELKKMNQYIK